MNGKVSKMLKKMELNDKRSKKAWTGLTPDQRGRIRSVFKIDGPNKALIQFGKELGNIV